MNLLKWHGLVFSVISVISVVNYSSARTLVTLEGDRIEGTITSISERGEILLAGRDRAVDLQGVREIERKVERVSAGLSAERLYLADGSVLVARNVTMGEGAIGFDWLGGAGTRMGVDQARGILLAPLSAKAGGRAEPEGLFAKAMGDAESRQDQLMVIGEEGLTVVPGALAGMDAKEVTFVWNGQSRKIDRHKVYGIVLAPPPPPEVLRTEDLTGFVRVELADGSTIGGKLAGLREGKLRLMRGANEMALPWEKVVAVRVRSGRMTFMSDLKVMEERTSATVTFGWPMRKDESVMGGPIEMGDRRFERGLGVHARSELSYDIAGQYRLFAAVIGLTPAPGSKAPAPGSGEGDCVFVVKGDGKTLLKQRMKAGEAWKEVRLDVSGVKRLELIVEEGENLDVGDLANWADARLIR
ncbi:MAG: NPCBM/NEW2 domain-containing protein [Phycisphaeraceae bacterium]